MTNSKHQSNNKLSAKNSVDSGIHESWEQDNQAWWDWYVTLAHNPDEYDKKELVDLPKLPSFNLSNKPEIEKELMSPYEITDHHCQTFRKEGFLKLPNVLSETAVLLLRKELKRILSRTFNVRVDVESNNRFLSLEMMWLENKFIRNYVLSPRIAKIAADLLGVPRIRLYHDNVLAKEPGCGRTPWHCDDYHFPLDTQKVVTAWIPAQPIPLSMGPLEFARPLDIFELVKDIKFNKFDTSYDRRVAEVFKLNEVEIEDGPFAIGEVSFHHNRSFHTAKANRTKQTRIVLANTFFADGARIVNEPTMVSGDWQKFIPNVGPGEIAATTLNPICWPPSNK